MAQCEVLDFLLIYCHSRLIRRIHDYWRRRLSSDRDLVRTHPISPRQTLRATLLSLAHWICTKGFFY